MEDEIQVIIIEDDPFARNWMTLLVARDWRTRVVADFEHPDMLPIYFAKNSAQKVDVVVLDTETLLGGNWVHDAIKAVNDSGRSARILCTGIVANERIYRKLTEPLITGYVLKGEIPYSLAWAINLAKKGKWVTTPQVYKMAINGGLSIPRSCTVLDGNQSPFRITDTRQAYEARLAILFSMERHELADELGIAEGWSYGKVRGYYQEMGLKEMLAEESALEENLKGENLILSYLEEMRKDYSGEGKVKWMETMAFHLLTMPKVVR
jgi:DNA-binding NarL/FixJ family response regulator